MSISVILILFLFASGSCLRGPNVCADKGRIYCCSEYEEINGECVACKTGFTSINGQVCQPWFSGLYGERCILPCGCSAAQRCHHIYGCKIDDLFTETINNEKTICISSQSFNVNFSEIERNEKTISITSRPFDVNPPDVVKNEFSKMDLTIYSTTVTGVVGTFCLIGLVYFCCRITKRFRLNKTLANTGFVNSTNEIVEMTEGIYNTIDEANMVSDTYLEAVNSSTNSESAINNSGIIESVCPHPYSNLIKTREIHTYDSCQPVHKKRSEQTLTEGNIGNVDSWTPYARCLNAQKDYSNYDLHSVVVVNASAQTQVPQNLNQKKKKVIAVDI